MKESMRLGVSKQNNSEGKTKINKICYYLQDKDDVNLVEIRKGITGLSKGNRNDISFIYIIRCDQDLGLGRDVVRRIPCARISCIEQFELPWENNEEVSNQKSYGVNKYYFYWNVFDGLNN